MSSAASTTCTLAVWAVEVCQVACMECSRLFTLNGVLSVHLQRVNNTSCQIVVL